MDLHTHPTTGIHPGDHRQKRSQNSSLTQNSQSANVRRQFHPSQQYEVKQTLLNGDSSTISLSTPNMNSFGATKSTVSSEPRRSSTHEEADLRTPRAPLRLLSDIPLCFTLSQGNDGTTPGTPGTPKSPGLKLPPSIITRHLPLPIQNLPTLPPQRSGGAATGPSPVRPSIRSVPSLPITGLEPNNEMEMDSDMDEGDVDNSDDEDDEEERNDNASGSRLPPANNISSDYPSSQNADSIPAISDSFGRLPNKDIKLTKNGISVPKPTGSLSKNGQSGDYFALPTIVTTAPSPGSE
jgi:hypothetical protein